MSVKDIGNDTFSAKQALAAGLSYMNLSQLVKSGKYERLARGIYEHFEQHEDIFYVAQLRRPKIVFSHLTALYLYDLSDQDLPFFMVTVPAGYNTKALRNEENIVFSLKKEYYESDIVKIRTNFGNFINVYSIERTVVDVFRSRRKMDPESVMTAIIRYSRERFKNIQKLMEIAKRFGVFNIIDTYLRALL
jgi:predicted transcriptional regulator of viral defense system